MVGMVWTEWEEWRESERETEEGISQTNRVSSSTPDQQVRAIEVRIRTWGGM
jgi:hypothetical protein